MIDEPLLESKPDPAEIKVEPAQSHSEITISDEVSVAPQDTLNDARIQSEAEDDVTSSFVDVTTDVPLSAVPEPDTHYQLDASIPTVDSSSFNEFDEYAAESM